MWFLNLYCMNILSLKLKNFRNFSEENFVFGKKINILTGANAQGKTNTAEAIFFLCTSYSPRASKDKYVIKNGEEEASAEAIAESKYGLVTVNITFNRNDKKRIFINGIEVHKVGELLGNIHSVFFNPQELKLVQESPEDRRRFMNVSLSQMSKNYFYALQRYNKILSQRNRLLKDENEYVIRETLPVWDLQLAKQAAKIVADRNEFLRNISPIAEEKHALITGGKETLKMNTDGGYYGSEQDIEYALLSDLKSSLEKDIRLGFTSIGPHRDDIKFSLNDLDARIYGSQGQQRTIALALKLAEAETFKIRFGEYPVLILDDVLSELDLSRQKRLIKTTADIQTIYTATGLSSAVFRDYDYKRIIIENGKIKSTTEHLAKKDQTIRKNPKKLKNTK